MEYLAPRNIGRQPIVQEPIWESDRGLGLDLYWPLDDPVGGIFSRSYPLTSRGLGGFLERRRRLRGAVVPWVEEASHRDEGWYDKLWEMLEAKNPNYRIRRRLAATVSLEGEDYSLYGWDRGNEWLWILHDRSRLFTLYGCGTPVPTPRLVRAHPTDDLAEVVRRRLDEQVALWPSPPIMWDRGVQDPDLEMVIGSIAETRGFQPGSLWAFLLIAYPSLGVMTYFGLSGGRGGTTVAVGAVLASCAMTLGLLAARWGPIRASLLAGFLAGLPVVAYLVANWFR